MPFVSTALLTVLASDAEAEAEAEPLHFFISSSSLSSLLTTSLNCGVLSERSFKNFIALRVKFLRSLR